MKPKETALEMIESFSEYVDSRDDKDYAIIRSKKACGYIIQVANAFSETENEYWNQVLTELKAMQ